MKKKPQWLKTAIVIFTYVYFVEFRCVSGLHCKGVFMSTAVVLQFPVRRVSGYVFICLNAITNVLNIHQNGEPVEPFQNNMKDIVPTDCISQTMPSE